MIRRAPTGWAALLVLVCCASASAQTPPPIQGTTTTVPGLTVADTLTQLIRPVGAPHVGEALGLATQLAVATAPFGASSGGFLIKLDPSTGLQVRTATTFGPSFAERALTTGEGKVSVGVNFTSVTYRQAGQARSRGLAAALGRRRLADAGAFGNRESDADREDRRRLRQDGRDGQARYRRVLPIVTVKVDGTTTLAQRQRRHMLFAQGSDVAKGLGDVAGLAKYRFLSFGSGQPDPGGLAVMATMRLPTGDRESLRGLGVTRTLSRSSPPADKDDSGRMPTSGSSGGAKGSARLGLRAEQLRSRRGTSIEYAAGLELEAAPKVTLLVDLLGGADSWRGQTGFRDR